MNVCGSDVGSRWFSVVLVMVPGGSGWFYVVQIFFFRVMLGNF